MRRGFSMTEILVVVAILVILAALSVPAYRAVRQKGQVQAARALLDELKLAIGTYASDQGDPPRRPSGGCGCRSPRAPTRGWRPWSAA